MAKNTNELTATQRKNSKIEKPFSIAFNGKVFNNENEFETALKEIWGKAPKEAESGKAYYTLGHESCKRNPYNSKTFGQFRKDAKEWCIEAVRGVERF